MKTDYDTGAAAQHTDEQPWHEIAVKLLGGTVESRPTITCECALWGSPCPHSFWSEERAIAAALEPV
jgi:hypothetical protein